MKEGMLERQQASIIEFTRPNSIQILKCLVLKSLMGKSTIPTTNYVISFICMVEAYTRRVEGYIYVSRRISKVALLSHNPQLVSSTDKERRGLL